MSVVLLIFHPSCWRTLIKVGCKFHKGSPGEIFSKPAFVTGRQTTGLTLIQQMCMQKISYWKQAIYLGTHSCRSLASHMKFSFHCNCHRVTNNKVKRKGQDKLIVVNYPLFFLPTHGNIISLRQVTEARGPITWARRAIDFCRPPWTCCCSVTFGGVFFMNLGLKLKRKTCEGKGLLCW